MITKKICLLGDFGIGKTSLVARFVHQTFSEKYLTTVGVKIDSKQLQTQQGQMVKLVVWDIAGSDVCSPQIRHYVRGSAGIILVADGTRRETLDAALEHRQVVQSLIDHCPMVFAFNKADLSAAWEITGADCQALKEMGITVFETSAKTGANVEALFQQLSETLASA